MIPKFDFKKVVDSFNQKLYLKIKHYMLKKCQWSFFLISGCKLLMSGNNYVFSTKETLLIFEAILHIYHG
jgi:hypothetical protein